MFFCKFFLLLGVALIITAMQNSAVFAQQEDAHIIVSENNQEKTKNDTINFLTYAAGEEEHLHKKTGLQVVGFLLIYALIMWCVKRKIWKGTHKHVSGQK